MASYISLDNPVFRSFAFYATGSVMKMMAMSFWTVKHRMGKKVGIIYFPSVLYDDPSTFTMIMMWEAL